MIMISEGDRDPISETSLAVLYHFCEWPEGQTDPISNEPGFSDEELHDMEIWGNPLGKFLKAVREYKNEPPTKS